MIFVVVRKLESTFLKAAGGQLIRRVLSVVLLDTFIVISMMVIPAAIVHRIETCFGYGGRCLSGIFIIIFKSRVL